MILPKTGECEIPFTKIRCGIKHRNHKSANKHADELGWLWDPPKLASDHIEEARQRGLVELFIAKLSILGENGKTLSDEVIDQTGQEIGWESMSPEEIIRYGIIQEMLYGMVRK